MWYTLTVQEIRRETSDTVSLLLSCSEEDRLDFAFKAGQYLTLRQEINGEDVRRSYSLCSSPSSSELRVAVKQVQDGRFSGYVHSSLQVGDQLQSMKPMGTFVRKDALADSSHMVAYAAGSGITPVLSLITEYLEQDEGVHFDLFYGNRRTESIIFKEELEALKNRFLGRFQLHYILSKERLQSDLFYGRITAEKCEKFGKYFYDADKIDQYFICGPEGMIESVRQSLDDQGVDAKRISFELFTSPVGPLKQKKEVVRPAGQKLSDVTITLDGLDMTFDMMSEDDNILDKALAEGADLPFACKGGVCSTCKAKVTSGKVDMSINYALEPDEVEAGYVLTCQAIPCTDKVVVNFDL